MSTTLPRLCLAGCLALGLSIARAQQVQPKPVSTPSPGYPAALTDTGLSGRAEVDFTVKTDGSVADAELATANQRAFGRAALDAVRTWRFEPGARDGVPVETRMSVPFVFIAPADQQVNAAAGRKVFVTLTGPVLSQKDYGAKLKVSHDAKPQYPRALIGSGIEETVEVRFVVGPDGTTLNPTIVGSPRKEFVVPALVAVARMTYEPPVRNNLGVYVEASAKLQFASDRRERFDIEGGGRRGGGMGGMRGGGMGGGR